MKIKLTPQGSTFLSHPSVENRFAQKFICSSSISSISYFKLPSRPLKIKSITIEASKKVNTTDDKIKALKNKLETLKGISEPSRQEL
jgi:hypothetical protein